MSPDSIETMHVAVYQRYLHGLLDNDQQLCRVNFQQWLDSSDDLRVLYEQLIQRSLYEVGELWERGRISVATEHFATAITESLLNMAYPRLFTQPRVGRSAVVACVANEHHQIGGKLVADIFELHGWRGYFLGANTPVRDLIELVSEKNPDVVALSVTVAFSMDSLLNAITEIRKSNPNIPILVGGQAFRWGGQQRVMQMPGVVCLRTLGELEEWIEDHQNNA